MLNVPTSILLTYGLLAAAIVMVWIKPLRLGIDRALPPWTIAFVLACASGILAGVLQYPAIVALGLFAGVVYACSRSKPGIVKIILIVATALLTLAISLHKLPGFSNYSIPYQVHLNGKVSEAIYKLNFDKVAAGLILFGVFCTPARSREDWGQVLRQYPIIFGVPLVVLAVGVATNYVVFDPKYVVYLPILVVANLLFTCIPEEAFFRGFLQEQLTSGMKRNRYGPYLAIVGVPLLFGLVHAKGGAVLVGLAVLAGLGYGYAYFRSKRIEAAILTHVLLNALNFAAFSRPSTF